MPKKLEWWEKSFTPEHSKFTLPAGSKDVSLYDMGDLFQESDSQDVAKEKSKLSKPKKNKN